MTNYDDYSRVLDIIPVQFIEDYLRRKLHVVCMTRERYDTIMRRERRS